MRNTFHLNVKRKWFDMILSGEKPEEYREIKTYWETRFWHLFPQELNGETFLPIVDSITFSNGYSKDRPQFEIELLGIEKGYGKPEWGAEPNKEYFVLKLGKLLYNVHKVNKVDPLVLNRLKEIC